MSCQKSYMYPDQGGLVGLWRSLCENLPKNNVRYKSKISQFDIEEKTLTTNEGLEIRFVDGVVCSRQSRKLSSWFDVQI